MTHRWHVICTKPQSENIAAASLEREGLELFYPRVRTPLPRPGRRYVPLFPGYLFVRYDFDVPAGSAVSRLPGVLGWMRLGGLVPPLPDEVISELAERVEVINGAGGIWPKFRAGEEVRVVSGPMETLAQVVEEPKSPQARVRVLMDFLGRQVSVLVPWHQLQPARGDSNIRGQRRTRGKGRWVRGSGPRAAVSV